MNRVQQQVPRRIWSVPKWLAILTVASAGLAFLSLFVLIWAKWGLITYLKSNFWAVCF